MRKQIIFLVILGLVIFVLGLCLGIFYKAAPSDVSKTAPGDVAKFLASKVVSAYAGGTVISINGRNITLSSNGEELAVPINSNASVNLFVQPAGANPYYQPFQFSEIKIGDRLNVNLGPSSGGGLEGKEVFISTPAAGGKTKGF